MIKTSTGTQKYNSQMISIFSWLSDKYLLFNHKYTNWSLRKIGKNLKQVIKINIDVLLEQEKLKEKGKDRCQNCPKIPSHKKGQRHCQTDKKSRPTETVPVVKEKQTQSPAFIDANRHKAMHSDNLV